MGLQGTKLRRGLQGGLIAILLGLGAVSCGSPEEETPPVAETAPAVDTDAAENHDAWWARLTTLCGRAHRGTLVSTDLIDAAFRTQEMTLHGRHCEEGRIEIPFHVGFDRSRTWILTRTDSGIQLEHDHRHEDGSPDVVTFYGGHTRSGGTEVRQRFPADARSRQLFEENELEASVDNIWTLEIVPGERFSYILNRPERHFQVDFDLTTEVEPPPAPWGHEEAQEPVAED